MEYFTTNDNAMCLVAAFSAVGSLTQQFPKVYY